MEHVQINSTLPEEPKKGLSQEQLHNSFMVFVQLTKTLMPGTGQTRLQWRDKKKPANRIEGRIGGEEEGSNEI